MSKTQRKELEQYFLFYILSDYYLCNMDGVTVGFHETDDFMEVYFDFKTHQP